MTAQILDLMAYEGRKMGVGCDISLRKHPRIRYVEGGEKNHFLTDSTACWKGCIGSWKITSGQLYLTELIGRFELVGKEPLLADWVSEKIRLVAGEIVKYVHMGYYSTYEYEIILKIKKGKVICVVEESVSRYDPEKV